MKGSFNEVQECSVHPTTIHLTITMRIVVDDILTVDDQKMQLLLATLIDKEIKVRHQMASNHFCVKRAALFSIAVAG